MLLLLFLFIYLTNINIINGLPLFWVGGVTSNSAKICIQTENNNIEKLLIKPINGIWNDNNSQEIIIDRNSYGFSCNKVENLTPQTSYHYGYQENNGVNILGSFSTSPKEKELTSFKFGFGSCEKFFGKGIVWDELKQKNADFFIHMGDLFYADIVENNIQLYKDSLYKFLSGKSQKNYLAEHPVFYMWDDHDFSDNNSCGFSPSRPAALEFYDKLTPHFDFEQDRENGVYQAFTYGNVRFILTDLRSKADNIGHSTLGDQQKEWLKKELSKFNEYSMVVWVSTKPWIGQKKNGKIDDKWYSFPEERTEIANHIADLKINNLVMIAGDAHLLAIDDGSHTDYSTNGGAGFPLMQSSPIAQYGSSKGGPFSSGCFSYRYYRNYQYAMMYIEDKADQVCFYWYGYIAGKSKAKFDFHRCIDKNDKNSSWVIKGSPGAGKCEIPTFPVWLSVIIGIVSFLLLAGICIGLYCLFICLRKRQAAEKMA